MREEGIEIENVKEKEISPLAFEFGFAADRVRLISTG